MRSAETINKITSGQVFDAAKNFFLGGAKGTFDAYSKTGDFGSSLAAGFRGRKGGAGTFAYKRPVYERGDNGKYILDESGKRIHAADESRPIKDADGNTTGYENKMKNTYISGAKVAGAMSGLGIGYRALSGGGLYRDKDGNVDIAGIPFV